MPQQGAAALQVPCACKQTCPLLLCCAGNSWSGGAPIMWCAYWVQTGFASQQTVSVLFLVLLLPLLGRIRRQKCAWLRCMMW
jgi:hypothetical protein